MAYEAFRDALAQITGDYARKAQDDRLHARDRSEKLSDVASERDYQTGRDKAQEDAAIRLAQAQSTISIEQWKAIDNATRLSKLRDLGIDGSSMSPEEQFARSREAAKKILTENTNNQAQAEYAAKEGVSDLQNTPEEVAKRETELAANNRKQIIALNIDYDNTVAQIKQLAATDPTASGSFANSPDLAKKIAADRVNDALGISDPKARTAALGGLAASVTSPNPTPAQIQVALSSSASVIAEAQKMAREINSDVVAQLRYTGVSTHPAVAALYDHLDKLSSSLDGLGVAPHPFLSPQQTPASPGAAPAVPAVPRGPVFNAPGSSKPTIVSFPASPVAPAAPRDWQTIGGAYDAVKAALSPGPAPDGAWFTLGGVGQAIKNAVTPSAAPSTPSAPAATAAIFLDARGIALPPDKRASFIATYDGITNNPNLDHSEKMRQIMNLQKGVYDHAVPTIGPTPVIGPNAPASVPVVGPSAPAQMPGSVPDSTALSYWTGSN